jgi:hypothetical protein
VRECSDVDPLLVDCNDDAAASHPEADEICDGLDNDCNFLCDEGFDADGDGYTSCASLIEPGEQLTCATADGSSDCAVDDPDVHPGAVERCNGVDDDCDGAPYPPVVGCYLGSPDGCELGRRGCDDSGGSGNGGFASCQPMEIPILVDPQRCDDYAVCEADPEEADPFACATATVPLRTTTCLVPVVGDQACAAESFPVNLNGSLTGCQWAVVGGKDHAHYRVGLLEGPGPGGSSHETAQSCTARLVVEAALATPQVERILVAEAEGGLDELVEVILVPDDQPACTVPGALQCDPLQVTTP